MTTLVLLRIRTASLEFTNLIKTPEVGQALGAEPLDMWSIQLNCYINILISGTRAPSAWAECASACPGPPLCAVRLSQNSMVAVAGGDCCCRLSFIKLHHQRFSVQRFVKLSPSLHSTQPPTSHHIHPSCKLSGCRIHSLARKSPRVSFASSTSAK